MADMFEGMRDINSPQDQGKVQPRSDDRGGGSPDFKLAVKLYTQGKPIAQRAACRGANRAADYDRLIA
jgi:hypothetical protein